MSNIDYIFAGHNQDYQYQAIQLLKRCFDEWHDFESRYGTVFPFREESFMAFNEKGQAVGHVGLMPFAVADGSGGMLKAAGVASVAVAPEMRRQGIADKLCRMAGEWAAEAGFDIMPLYTGMAQVYGKSFWKVVPPNGAVLLAPEKSNGAVKLSGRIGAELSVNEKMQIIQHYMAMPPVPGRVLRNIDGLFHSWEWFFASPLHQWLVDEKVPGYALSIDGVLAEAAGDIEYYTSNITGLNKAFLSFTDPVYSALTAANWQAQEPETLTPECWHGECAMNYVLPGRSCPENLFLPLGDKF